MPEAAKPKKIVGRAEILRFPELGLSDVPARIDTGAKTSSIWASKVVLQDGRLNVTFFDAQSPLYTGRAEVFDTFEEVMVASSTGHQQLRYKVKVQVVLKGKKVRAGFTLADRSTQAYPVLIGRNVLHGKFIVDVKQGNPQYDAERVRRDSLRQARNRNGQQEEKA